MKKIIQLKLKFLAKMILARYKPKVIGITGSVGKTSAKNAIFMVVSSKFNARASQKNYNNEIGVPLTIIGSSSAGRSVFGWIKIFVSALKLILLKDKNYPEVLVLEMGVDRPGDMDYLNSIVSCDVGVITTISHSHLEYFGSLENIKKEKFKLIGNLKKNGLAVLNFNDKEIAKFSGTKEFKYLSYGFEDGVDIRAKNLAVKNSKLDEKNGDGIAINFSLVYGGETVNVLLENCFGDVAVMSVLAGVSSGIAIGMSLDEAGRSASVFKMPPGRMNIIPGIKDSIIVDDTYNSSPQSVISTLEAIRGIEIDDGSFRFAVLGDMLELGSYEEEGHLLVGSRLLESDIDVLVAVGERSKGIIQGAKKAGMRDEFIFHFKDSESAGEFVWERVQHGDLVFVKGSQGARMEKVVKKIMADPSRAEEFLVRQGKGWD